MFLAHAPLRGLHYIMYFRKIVYVAPSSPLPHPLSLLPSPSFPLPSPFNPPTFPPMLSAATRSTTHALTIFFMRLYFYFPLSRNHLFPQVLQLVNTLVYDGQIESLQVDASMLKVLPVPVCVYYIHIHYSTHIYLYTTHIYLYTCVMEPVAKKALRACPSSRARVHAYNVSSCTYSGRANTR